MVTNGRVKELRRLLGLGRTLGDSARMAAMNWNASNASTAPAGAISSRATPVRHGIDPGSHADDRSAHNLHQAALHPTILELHPTIFDLHSEFFEPKPFAAAPSSRQSPF